MKKIALDGDFNVTDEQIAHLNTVGQVDKLESVDSDEAWLEAIKGYDVVLNWGDHVLTSLAELFSALGTPDNSQEWYSGRPS